jgi:ubiquinone/menaquinone biosynthesis C-methylase UbiE
VAIDHGILRENLRRFYDFTDKVVLYVGAGGRQLLAPSIKTAKLIAIDQNARSLQELQRSLADHRLPSVETIASRFEDITIRGDVVYFEFCLHEMADPDKALLQARTLAPDTVVFDHSPNSGWTFHAAEEDEVRRSAAALERFGVRRREQFSTNQLFRDHAELLAKISVQGGVAITRAEKFVGTTAIVIPMRYELVLV